MKRDCISYVLIAQKTKVSRCDKVDWPIMSSSLGKAFPIKNWLKLKLILQVKTFTQLILFGYWMHQD